MNSLRNKVQLIGNLGEDPQVIVNQLYQYTPMQTTQSIINLVIDRGQPRTLDLRGLLDAYLVHRKEIIRRRTHYLLNKAEERLHIVEGFLIAIDNIDLVVSIIRSSANTPEARERLIEALELTEIQAQRSKTLVEIATVSMGRATQTVAGIWHL